MIEKLLSDTALYTIQHLKEVNEKLTRENEKLMAENRELREFKALMAGDLTELPKVKFGPTLWPTEDRIDIIGSNGNDGAAYKKVENDDGDTFMYRSEE